LTKAQIIGTHVFSYDPKYPLQKNLKTTVHQWRFKHIKKFKQPNPNYLIVFALVFVLAAAIGVSFEADEAVAAEGSVGVDAVAVQASSDLLALVHIDARLTVKSEIKIVVNKSC